MFKAPWKPGGIYVCATHRRKPGICGNTLALPMAATDEAVLGIDRAGEVLGTTFIEELLGLVDKGEADMSAQLEAERERLPREIKNLVNPSPWAWRPRPRS